MTIQTLVNDIRERVINEIRMILEDMNVGDEPNLWDFQGCSPVYCGSIKTIGDYGNEIGYRLGTSGHQFPSIEEMPLESLIWLLDEISDPDNLWRN